MQIQKTPLNSRHRELGANMAEFGGYDMPLWYSSAKNEHLAVLQSAGIFDTSHMSPLNISGPQAGELLQFCFTRDLRYCLQKNQNPLVPGRCVYGVILNESGQVLDDAVLSQTEQNSYLLMVNAGMGGEIKEHFRSVQKDLGVEAQIQDLTDSVGKLDLQGPDSARILAKILKDPSYSFKSLPYFSFKGHFDPENKNSPEIQLVNNDRIMLSRSGYTGEFGFEIFIEATKLANLWDILLDSGKEFGLQACGLAARDSLRTGAVLPLSHQDIGHWPFINNPWTFALPYRRDKQGFTKDFIGGQALEKLEGASFTYPFVGYDPRKITPGENSLVSFRDQKIGEILTCTTDMGIGWQDNRIYSLRSPDKPSDFKPRGLCCGFVKVDFPLDYQQEIELRDSRRSIRVLLTRNIRPDRTCRKSLFPE